MSLIKLNISQIHQGLKEKDFSALELCQEYLTEIKKKNQDIFAYLFVNQDLVLAKAKQVDQTISSGQDFSLLTGVPGAIKDNILVKGIPCTASSKSLENYLAPYNATVIERLNKENCLILGKTNLDEFAMGSSTENSSFGPTRNPFDLTRVAGGSSGGSAAAVAANLSAFSLGSDTGGSIRLPACFCGAVGLKPTYGTVSRYGLIAFASSLDQIGPIAKTVQDVEIVFNTIKGKDEMDSTSVDLEKNQTDFSINQLKIGVPKEYLVQGINPEIKQRIEQVVEKYQAKGALIKEISLPSTEQALSCYYIIACSEAAANLARYDGIKYGYSAIEQTEEKINNLLDIYLKSREKGFREEVKRRIMIGTYSLSAGYYQAYYLKAQKARNQIINDFDKAFEKVDLIVAPVSPVLPFKIGEKVENPLEMYLADIYTVSVNLAGLPALSMPCGQINDLPTGFQIISKHFQEDKIFKAAKFYEKH
jgi:aspartyl-tRNA(Asn)/glutamyl-tRNA(Gln) amidotransferase subunit A